ncbi:MAG TPA: VOC family protein [Caulobacteraceae bacterium]|nr:VOC family protein [Caulobacteraceae bacterium]
MKISGLGHVVLKVTDCDRAEAFYEGLLGIPVCARFDEGGFRMSFFSLGNHHDFAVMQVSGEGGRPAETSPGLAHVAFKIGDSLDQLREAKASFDAAGVETRPIDHEVTKSLYFHDPDGNEIEVYVDVTDAWKREPQRVAQMAPLEL